MYDVITLGGATEDVFMESKYFMLTGAVKNPKLLCLRHGAKINIGHVDFNLGGGGLNTAVSFSRLGLKTAFCGIIGDDGAGKEVQRQLEKKKITKEFLVISKKHKTGISIVLHTKGGERTILLYRGANDYLTPNLVLWKRLKKTHWLYISHLSGKSHRLINKLISFKKINPGIRIAWNPGSTQLKLGLKKLKSFLAQVDILFLDKEEAEELCKISTKKSFLPLFNKLAKTGPNIIIITDGAKGVQAWLEGKVYHAPALKVKVVDATGAGDSFGAAFTAGIIYTNNLETALAWGIVNSASTIQKVGAQEGILNKKEIKKSSKKVKVKII